MRTGRDLLNAVDLNAVPPGQLAAELSSLVGAPARSTPRTRYNLACYLSLSQPLQALGILADDSRRSARPWALDDPALAMLRTGEHGASFRAGVRRGRSLDPAASLARLDAVGVAGAERLARAGIISAADLVRLVGPKEARARIAAATGLAAGQLYDWANLAEIGWLIETRCHPDADQGGDERSWPGRTLDIANLLWLTGINSAPALVNAARSKGGGDSKPLPDLAKVGLLAGRLTSRNRRETVMVGTEPSPDGYLIGVRAVEAWFAVFAEVKSEVEPGAVANDESDNA
jgi:hypothetical protein